MKSKFTPQLVEFIKQNYKEGHSIDELKHYLEEQQIYASCGGIRKKLKKEGVKIRSIKESIILHYRKKEPINKILELYIQNIPIRELARRFKMGRGTINKILREHNISIRESRPALIAMGYIREKQRFNLSPQEKAYLFGLVMGDLTPVKKSSYTLKLITYTTHPAFRDLLCKTFQNYGPVSANINKRGEYRFSAYLDIETFSFLLDAKQNNLPPWIDKHNFLHFLAGFVDSDGSVSIKKALNRVQCVVRFFGENIALLREIKEILYSLGYHASMHKTHQKGRVSYHHGILFRYNKDYFTLEVYRKNEVFSLLKILPLRHPEKIAKKNLAFVIYDQGIRHWTDIEKEVVALRNVIKESVLTKKTPVSLLFLPLDRADWF